MKYSGEDRLFVKAFGYGLLALAGSALLLLACSYIYLQATSPKGAGNTYSKTISGKQLKRVMGAARVNANAIEITGFKTLNNQEHALVSLKTRLRAENYPFLSYQFEGWDAGQRVNFIWRTARNPRGLSTTILNRSLDKPGIVYLAKDPDWTGSVTEIGLHVVGGNQDQPLNIPAITLEPPGWGHWLRSIWSEWTAFRGWSATSINFLEGAPGPIGSATLSPTVAMALWSGLALFILFISGVVLFKQNPISYVTVILAPWLAMDLLWQRELNTQLVETKSVFAGKSMNEKHLEDNDAHIYSHAQRLKTKVLPSSPARIFILNDAAGHNFERLKMQYYLLPHNIYNFGSVPPGHGVHAGDYILTLGDSSALEFHPGKNLLSWPAAAGLEVKLIDSDPLGNLYQVPGGVSVTP